MPSEVLQLIGSMSARDGFPAEASISEVSLFLFFAPRRQLKLVHDEFWFPWHPPTTLWPGQVTAIINPVLSNAKQQHADYTEFKVVFSDGPAPTQPAAAITYCTRGCVLVAQIIYNFHKDRPGLSLWGAGTAEPPKIK